MPLSLSLSPSLSLSLPTHTHTHARTHTHNDTTHTHLHHKPSKNPLTPPPPHTNIPSREAFPPTHHPRNCRSNAAMREECKTSSNSHHACARVKPFFKCLFTLYLHNHLENASTNSAVFQAYVPIHVSQLPPPCTWIYPPCFNTPEKQHNLLRHFCEIWPPCFTRCFNSMFHRPLFWVLCHFRGVFDWFELSMSARPDSLFG